jgi:hypothetical protein
MRQFLCSLTLLTAAALLPGVPRAEGPGPYAPDEAMRRAEDLAREGLDKLLEAVEALKDAVPQYGVPYIDPQGNIVFPRLPPGAPAPSVQPGKSPLRS